MLLLIMGLLWASDFEPLHGVPPGFVNYQVSGGIQPSPLELTGTTNPLHLVVAGVEVPFQFEKTNSKNETTGLFVNGQKVKTQGKPGIFFHSLKGKNLLPKGNKVTWVTDQGTWTAHLSYQRHFFDSPIDVSMTYPVDEAPEHWVFSGSIPKDVKVQWNKSKSKTVHFQKQVKIRIPLQEKAGDLKLLVTENGQRRSVIVPFQITKRTYSPDNFYFALECDGACGSPWDVDFYGENFQGKTNPGNRVRALGQSLAVDSNGQFQLDIKSQCREQTNGAVEFAVSGKTEEIEFSKTWVSRSCQRFQEKDKSRFYVAGGLFGFTVMDSPADNVRTLYSENIEPRPRLGLGARVYDKYYLDLRVASLGYLKNSTNHQWVNTVDFNALSLGYPYRGRWFGALGFATYKVDYNEIQNGFFFGGNSRWAAAMFLEVGHRFYLTPSLTLNSRILVSPAFFSFQSDPIAQWPFVNFEPLTLEYHFL